MGCVTHRYVFFIVYAFTTCGIGTTHTHQTNDNRTSHKKEVFLSLPDDEQLFEGDIMMDKQFRKIITSFAEEKKSALIYGGVMDIRWPNGVVYYVIDRSFSLWSQLVLSKAIYQFKTRTCIRFIKRKKEPDYVIFSSRRNGCFSYIGRLGGPQTINLEKACTRLGTFEHEMMHALGIIHEHSRPDRDNFIKVQYDNIEREDLNNFQKYPYFEIDDLGEPFNFASLMMYPNQAFSRNGRSTIRSIDEPELSFGQRQQFSVGDVREINRFYDCHKYLDEPRYDGLVRNYITEKGKHRHLIGKFEKVMQFVQWFLQDIHLIFVF